MSLEALAYLHRDELVVEAQNQRMAEQATETHPPMTTRLMKGVGEALTQAGEHLRERAQDAQLQWELKQCGEPHAAR
jgi:hypothetical protein